jgi:hypothetical protein
MLSKEQRVEIAKKVHAKAVATNATLSSKYDKDVLVAYACQRADAVISALDAALKKAYSEVTDAQLLRAKNVLNAKQNGNRDARRKAQVEANKATRKAAADEKKRLRIEARKAAALEKKKREKEAKNS